MIRVQAERVRQTNKQSYNDLSQSPSRESGTNGTREPPVHTAHTAQVQNNFHDDEYDYQDDDGKNDQDNDDSDQNT